MSPPMTCLASLPSSPAGIRARREYRAQGLSRIASPVIKAEPVSPILRSATPVLSNSTDNPQSPYDATVIKVEDDSDAFGSQIRPDVPYHEASPSSVEKHASPVTAGTSPFRRRRVTFPIKSRALTTPTNNNVAATPINISSGSGSGSGSGFGFGSSKSRRPRLTLKLRCIQSAFRDYKPPPNALGSSPSNSNESPMNSASHQLAGRKRTATETEDEDDTDSELELFPSKPRSKRTVKTITKNEVKKCSPVTTKTKKTRMTKKTKITHHAPSLDDDDTMFDAGDEQESMSDKAQLSLVTPVLKRNKRILDLNNPEHATLIANASKVGSEYYDSDVDDLPGDVKDTNKPHLFRNIQWGTSATDYSGDFPREPDFTQFVPGRFELQPDGTLADQKAKLIVKLTDKTGRKRIFANPPPRDWQNQEAITALNKRTVQQIRRNTNVRFREVVRAYVTEERGWILANLTKGKPTKGWKSFVDEFNKRFEGKTVAGVAGTRPHRSHSSLTKEVERFSPQYGQGLVPVPAKKVKKE